MAKIDSVTILKVSALLFGFGTLVSSIAAAIALYIHW